MFAILENRTYRHLFGAQISALLGTGLATVALGLLAFDLRGQDAGVVLSAIFTIKMVIYVSIAPLAGAFARKLDRRRVLIALDIVRAIAALALPFASALWHVFALMAVLHAASAAFTPIYQATLPDVLPEERDYTRALSLSRFAYELENIASPTLAALLLVLVPYSALFFGTMAGFVASALLLLSVVLPRVEIKDGDAPHRVSRGIRIYLATPRLRGLLGFTLAASAAGAMVLVNTVVLVRGALALPESALAWTMASFGAGAMLAAFALPRILDHVPDRRVLCAGAVISLFALGLTAVADGAGMLRWTVLLGIWAVIGVGYSAVMTPSGRLLRRSAHAEDRGELFAAQFALSHAGWMITYPSAGVLMSTFGTQGACIGLGILACVGLVTALRLWPYDAQDEVSHRHDTLPSDHPHIQEGRTHTHPLIIDDLHPRWDTRF